MSENFGINKTKYALDNALDILKKMLDVFEDGVQFSDSFALFGIGKDFYDIASAYQDVKKEALDYSAKEIEEIIKEFSERAIRIFWTNSQEDYKGIDNILKIIDAIYDLYSVIIKYTKDGVTVDDVDSIPELKDIILRGIKYSPEAKLEIDDLNAKEIAVIASNLASRLFILFNH